LRILKLIFGWSFMNLLLNTVGGMMIFVILILFYHLPFFPTTLFPTKLELSPILFPPLEAKIILLHEFLEEDTEWFNLQDEEEDWWWDEVEREWYEEDEEEDQYIVIPQWLSRCRGY